MTRRSLKFELWPATDRALWQKLTASGHILDEAGPGAHWRPGTRRILMRDYGFWLAYLAEAGVDLVSEDPVARFSRDRVRGYISSLFHRAASTQAGALRALVVIMERAAPAADWRWLKDARRPLDAAERRLRGRSKRHRIVSAHKLYEAGMRLMESASAAQRQVGVDLAVDFRDGLIIALLACRPLRLANLTGLRLGSHVTPYGEGHRIDIPGAETKTGQPIETLFPASLLPAFTRYLEIYRPLLLGGGTSDCLWIGRSGQPVGYHHLGLRVADVTERLLGVRVSPHLFRTAAATTIATADPMHVGTIMPLLGHATPVTAELYYNQARSIEAGRAHQANIRQIREDTRPLRRRTAPRIGR